MPSTRWQSHQQSQHSASQHSSQIEAGAQGHGSKEYSSPREQLARLAQRQATITIT
jgi:hypothetical protein